LEAINRGYRVTVVTGKAEILGVEREAIKSLGGVDLVHKRAMFSSSSKNLITEFAGFIQVIYFLRKMRPDVVHCISPKGILYGSLACHFVRVSRLVVAVSGMGSAYSHGKIGDNRSLFMRCYEQCLKLALSHKNLRMIVQNIDDQNFFINNKFVRKKNITLIPGSGVQLEKFNRANPKVKDNIILLPARLIKEKGIYEFADAAVKLKIEFPDWKFVVAGALVTNARNAVSKRDIDRWVEQGVIDYLGYVSDMVPIFIKAAIVCLPSYYREGMPKALLEAAAAGCAVVTCDSVGCRDAVIAGVTADLVIPKDATNLCDTLRLLMKDVVRRRRYGFNGKKHAENNYSIGKVIDTHFELYEFVL